jgi:uncharacterized membrane protein YphA (DoxX/SURF4 family)
MKITKAQVLDYFILCLRWYVAFYMVSYGIAKMTGGQFGVSDPKLLNTPLKDIDTFHLAWRLFGQSKLFSICVGLSQIAGSILIVIPRTRLIGALVLLPILANIFLIDVCFTTGMFGPALPLRLFMMITADLLILYHSREQMITAWLALTRRRNNILTHKWWMLIILPVMGFLMDFIFAIVTWPVKMLWCWAFIWPHK